METTTATPILAMEKGTYVRVNGLPSTGDQRYVGKIATISDRSTDASKVWVRFLNQCYDSGSMENIAQIADLVVMPDQDDAPRQQELEAWKARYEYQSERVIKYQEGIDKLGEYAMEIADNNNYCSQYDDVVEAVNMRLDRNGYNLVQLPVREQEYEVLINVRATIWGSTTVMVTARNEQDALDRVRDCPDEYTDFDVLLSESISMETPDYDVDVELA